MVDVMQRERDRENYLLALYELADGMLVHWTTHRAIADAAGLSDSAVIEVGQHLAQEHLCKFETMGGLEGSVSITTQGISKAERLLTTRTPRIGDSELMRCVEAVVLVLRDELESDQSLGRDDRLNIESDLQSVEDQLRAPSPNRGVVRAVFGRIIELWPAILNLSTVAANIITIRHGA